MSESGKMWSMTRHERRGTIVILVLIALLLGATVMVRSCRDDTVTTTTDVQRFQQEVDSVAKAGKPTDAPHGKPSKTTKSKRHRARKPERPKTPPKPRPVDPVPQF